MDKDFSRKFFPGWDSWDPSEHWTSSVPAGENWKINEKAFRAPRAERAAAQKNGNTGVFPESPTAEDALMMILIMLYAIAEKPDESFSEDDINEYFELGNWEQLQDAGLELIVKLHNQMSELRKKSGRRGFRK